MPCPVQQEARQDEGGLARIVCDRGLQQPARVHSVVEQVPLVVSPVGNLLPLKTNQSSVPQWYR
jgi:hypothetical protein